VSVTERSDAVNAGMAMYTEGRLLSLHAGLRPQLDLWLVDLPAYEDGTECSETSAYKIQTPENYP
jgi:hypothetical protein